MEQKHQPRNLNPSSSLVRLRPSLDSIYCLGRASQGNSYYKTASYRRMFAYFFLFVSIFCKVHDSKNVQANHKCRRKRHPEDNLIDRLVSRRFTTPNPGQLGSRQFAAVSEQLLERDKKQKRCKGLKQCRFQPTAYRWNAWGVFGISAWQMYHTSFDSIRLKQCKSAVVGGAPRSHPHLF